MEAVVGTWKVVAWEDDAGATECAIRRNGPPEAPEARRDSGQDTDARLASANSKATKGDKKATKRRQKELSDVSLVGKKVEVEKEGCHQ